MDAPLRNMTPLTVASQGGTWLPVPASFMLDLDGPRAMTAMSYGEDGVSWHSLSSGSYSLSSPTPTLLHCSLSLGEGGSDVNNHLPFDLTLSI